MTFQLAFHNLKIDENLCSTFLKQLMSTCLCQDSIIEFSPFCFSLMSLKLCTRNLAIKSGKDEAQKTLQSAALNCQSCTEKEHTKKCELKRD